MSKPDYLTGPGFYYPESSEVSLYLRNIFDASMETNRLLSELLSAITATADSNRRPVLSDEVDQPASSLNNTEFVVTLEEAFGTKTANALRDAGVTSVQKATGMNMEDLVNINGIGAATAKKIMTYS